MHQKGSSMPWRVRFVLIAAFLSAPGMAQALGLGKMTLHSGLDEPLSADIELTSVNPSELKSLRTGLASRADFDNAGIDWMPLLSNIKYDVVKQPDGSYILRLTTDQPVREPFLHFLLQADWTGGHLIHEYTALLDPPYLVASKPAAVAAPEVPVPTEVPLPDANDQTAAIAKSGAEGLTKPGEAPASPANADTKVANGSSPEAKVADTASKDATPQALAQGPASSATATTTPGSTTNVAAVVPSSGNSDQETSPLEPDESKSGSADQEVTTPAGKVENATPSDWASRKKYGPIRKGDTLWRIADRVRADKSLSLEQVMIALLKANRSAFDRNNVNNLKTGRILTVPERAQVEAVDKTRAAKEFRAQYDVWQEYKLRLAAAHRAIKVNETPSKASAKGVIAAQSSESAGPKTEQPKSPAATAGKSSDLLKIVRDNLGDDKNSQAGKAGATNEQKRLADKVSTLEEAIESREMENKELRDRVSQLEAQLKNTKRLIDIENGQLALAQKQATGDKANQVAAPTTPAPLPTKNVPVGAPIAKETNAPKAPPIAAPVQKPATPPVAPAAAPPRKAPNKVVPPAETAQVSFLDSLLDSPVILAMFGGVVVIAGGVLMVYYRRRRRSIAEFEESILSGGGLNSEGHSAAASGTGGEVSLLSEFSQGGMGNIHTDEVDPIAEAEVYLAYGRDEQAEEILKEAVVKDPGRHELRQKLLEIYHQRNDVASFETVAEELYAALEGKGGKVWERVEEMGRKMNPQNPLFRGGGPALRAAPASVAPAPGMAASMFEMTAPAPQGDSLEFNMPSAVNSAASRVPSPPVSAADTGLADALNFDLAPAAPPKGVAPPGGTPADLTFDLDLNPTPAHADADLGAIAFEPSLSPAPSAVDADLNLSAPSLSADSDPGGIDFEATVVEGTDLGIELEDNASAVGGDSLVEWSLEVPAAATDGAEISFETSDSEGAELDAGVEGLVSSDEIATKLDLAKAYIDMGDAEGARSILNEVTVEGNDLQKKQAAELAAQIA